MPYATVSAQRPNAEMNITPLVDVMLVLLVIFMIAMPVLSQPISIGLQQAPPDASTALPPDPIDLRIDASGQFFWNGEPAPMSALPQMMQAEVQRAAAHPPTLRIDSSDDAEYEVLAKVLAAALTPICSASGSCRTSAPVACGGPLFVGAALAASS